MRSITIRKRRYSRVADHGLVADLFGAVPGFDQAIQAPLAPETGSFGLVAILVLNLEPDCSISDLRKRISAMFRYEEDFESYAQGLRLAGLPEE